MKSETANPHPPSGLSRLLYRAPITLYKLGLGGVMGNRIALLNHIGRKSKQPRQTALEVVDYDKDSDTVTVVSAWGDKSDWYRNLLEQPNVTIQLGRRTIPVTAEPISPEEGGDAMVIYARRHPRAARELLSVVGYSVDGSEESYRRLGRESLRFVALRPRSPSHRRATGA